MPFPLIPLIISGVSALGGALANRRSKAQQEQRQVQDFSRTEDINLSELPAYDPEALSLRNALIAMYRNNLTLPPDFIESLQTNALLQANRGSDLLRRNLESSLAARGLTGSPVGAAAIAQNEANRIAQGNQFMMNLPVLLDQINRERMGESAKFFSSLPTGTRRIGTTRSTGAGTTTGIGTTTQPGNVLGGLFGSLGTALAGLYGMGAFGNNPYLNRRSPYNYNVGGNL